jgi:hypothetical protein
VRCNKCQRDLSDSNFYENHRKGTFRQPCKDCKKQMVIINQKKKTDSSRNGVTEDGS